MLKTITMLIIAFVGFCFALPATGQFEIAPDHFGDTEWNIAQPLLKQSEDLKSSSKPNIQEQRHQVRVFEEALSPENMFRPSSNVAGAQHRVVSATGRVVRGTASREVSEQLRRGASPRLYQSAPR